MTRMLVLFYFRGGVCQSVSLDGSAFLIEYRNLALLTSKHFTKNLSYCVSGKYFRRYWCWELPAGKNGNWWMGAIFPASRNLPGGLKCYSWNLKKKRFYSHRLNRLVNFYFFHLISRIKLLKIFPVNKKDPE